MGTVIILHPLQCSILYSAPSIDIVIMFAAINLLRSQRRSLMILRMHTATMCDCDLVHVCTKGVV
jgi:hypothetical protein